MISELPVQCMKYHWETKSKLNVESKPGVGYNITSSPVKQ